MGQAKPWQIVLVVAALTGAGVMLYLSVFSGPKLNLATSVQMVDVNSGERFRIDIGKGLMFPAANPKTRARSLMPLEQRDGRWFISERYISSLESIEGGHEAVVDAKTGEVKVQGG